MKRIKATDLCRGPVLATVPSQFLVEMTKLILKGLRIWVALQLSGRGVGYAHPEQRRRGSEGRSAASTLCFVSSIFLSQIE